MRYEDFLVEFSNRHLSEFEKEGYWEKVKRAKEVRQRAKRLKKYKADKKPVRRALKGAEKTYDVGAGAVKKTLGAAGRFARKHPGKAAGIAVGAYAAHKLLRRKCAKKYPPQTDPASYKRCMSRLGRD
jgi:hypothetical protein